MSRRGRKHKLTPELTKKIASIIAKGNTAKTACHLVGIGTTTYYRWLRTADEPKARKEFREFKEAIEKAEAFAAAKRIEVITKAMDAGTWQAAAWWLERRQPDEWGLKRRHEISGPDGGPIQHVEYVAEWGEDESKN